jgi:hypothetical protein
MVFKLATQAERNWRRLNSHKLINLVDGDSFVDGELQLKEAHNQPPVAPIRSLARPPSRYGRTILIHNI